jgi:hypothetical protein
VAQRLAIDQIRRTRLDVPLTGEAADTVEGRAKPADHVFPPDGNTAPAVAGHMLKYGTHPGGWRFKPPQWPVPAHVRTALGVEDGVALTCLSRWRQPHERETVYLRNDCCPGFSTRHHHDVPLYETLSRYYGLVPEHATLQWYPPSSSNAVSDVGGAGTREPVLRIRQTTFTSDGRAFEHVEVHHAHRPGVDRNHASDQARGR